MVEVLTPVVFRYGRAIADHTYRILVVCRPVTSESVRPLISNVRDLHGHCGRQLGLDRGIPHIDRSRALHRRTNPRVHVVERSPQRDRAIRIGRRVDDRWGRIGHNQRSQLRLIRTKIINREVVTEGSGKHVIRVYVLVDKNREVLRHSMAEVRAEYADIEAAPVADTYDSLWPQLIRDAESRPECADIVTNAAV